jgi:hypothetical protein
MFIHIAIQERFPVSIYWAFILTTYQIITTKYFELPYATR